MLTRIHAVVLGLALSTWAHAWEALPAIPPIPADNPMSPENDRSRTIA